MAATRARQRRVPPHSGRVDRGGSRPDEETNEEAFPPLSVSLEAFVKDGSDQGFRRLIYSLISLSDIMERNRDYFAAYIGTSTAQLLMMAVIAETVDPTVSGVAEQLSVSSQFVTMEIGKLIAKEIVLKRPNEADRRSMILSLTSRGEALLRELGPVRRKINDMTFRSLSEERAKALQEIVDGLLIDGRIAIHELDAPHMRGKMAPSAWTNVGRPGGQRLSRKAALMPRLPSETKAR